MKTLCALWGAGKCSFRLLEKKISESKVFSPFAAYWNACGSKEQKASTQAILKTFEKKKIGYALIKPLNFYKSKGSMQQRKVICRR